MERIGINSKGYEVWYCADEVGVDYLEYRPNSEYKWSSELPFDTSYLTKSLCELRTEALAKMPKSVEVEADIQIIGEQCTLAYYPYKFKALKEFKGVSKVKVTITEVVE